MSKLFENCIVLMIAGVIASLGNVVGAKVSLGDSLIGMSVIIGVALVALLLGVVPFFKRIYSIIIVTVIAVFISSPWFPFHQWIVAVTDKVQFMSIATTLLAYAGLSLAKDLAIFKRLSWQMIPVAMAVCAGTFLFATVIAQYFLQWEGVI